MTSRFRLAAVPVAAVSLFAAAPAALAGRVPSRHIRPTQHLVTSLPPHHRDITPVTGNQPGIQVQPLVLPTPSYNVHNLAQLQAALQSVQGGQVIHLASGSVFSTLWVTKAYPSWVTISGAGDAVAPQIQGARLEGAQNLRFTNVEFTKRVYIARNPSHVGQDADNVQIVNTEVNCGSTATKPWSNGLTVRQASQNVTIAGDYVHNCTLGFTSYAQDNPSQGLTVVHNVFQNFYGDAMDIGGLANTAIEDNIIQNIGHSPGVTYHDDGIQFLGNTTNTVISNNVLDNSFDQLIFIQDAIKGEFNGIQTNSNITIDHNLIYGAGASAVQDEGGVNTSFDDNTVWDSHNGAFVLRKSPYTGTPPSSTVMQGNILQSYIQMGAPGTENDNMIQTVSRWTAGQLSPTDIVGVAPSFVSEATGDFALVPGTPGSGTGSPTASVLSFANKAKAKGKAKLTTCPTTTTTTTDPSTPTTTTTATTSTTTATTPTATTTSASCTPATTTAGPSAASANTATMLLGANPVNMPYGAPVYGAN
jgi:hypothetical protein